MRTQNIGATGCRQLVKKPSILCRCRKSGRIFAQQYQRQGGFKRNVANDRSPQQQYQQGNYDFPPQPQRSYGGGAPPPPPPDDNKGNNNSGRPRSSAWIAAAFIFGIGAGVWFDKDFNYEPQNVASTEIIDRRTPNQEVCMANGYSAMVFDQRIYLSFNPFNVYVSQPEVKPGCVLRRSNYNVLENRQLVNNKEVESCKKNMNTFAFVGDLEDNPEINCVYHSEDAENQYLINPMKATMGDGYQQRDKPAQSKNKDRPFLQFED
eukprot:TRINITY_DN4052_c0_g2_i6.p2 TRINITY_DN4052_c0_g2~~TRINITY_DN4052_c0_g2_i6.p2  ORF type:complete len:264 (-),score=28.52 TRINITY_DN4052_c0_g2_i6:154-945(-)